MSTPPRHTCLKLDLVAEDPKSKNVVFVKGTWHPSHFDLSISDGSHAWTYHASEEEVSRRAEQWDQPVPEYVALAERYLGFQQPGSVYRFEDSGNGRRRLSWTLEKEGTKLECRWKCEPSSNDREITLGILDFLMDANIRLSEEVVRKTQASEKLKLEAHKCLEQSERLASEKADFESTMYSKFVAVLNSKKSKLRELRGRISKLESVIKHPEEEERTFTDKTETFNGEEEDGIKEDILGDQSTSSKLATSSSLKAGRGTTNGCTCK